MRRIMVGNATVTGLSLCPQTTKQHGRPTREIQ